MHQFFVLIRLFLSRNDLNFGHLNKNLASLILKLWLMVHWHGGKIMTLWVRIILCTMNNFLIETKQCIAKMLSDES
jgi:hypothetical protein